MRVVLIVFLTTLLLGVAGCGEQVESGDLTWSVIESPITGKCYEVATDGKTMAMVKASCSTIRRKRKR
tara:strand:- start:151 stop:354 length:204 start_codon:yes stop_codon:yes gene_type:complete